MSTIHLVSALLFIVSACLLMAAERFKEDYEGLSRKLALGSLAAVFGAGVLFVMDVPQIGGLMNPWAKTAKAKKKGGRQGNDSDDEEGEAQRDAGARGSGGGKTEADAASKKSAAAQPAGKGSGAEEKALLPECEGCPTFVNIAPGSSMIGADAADPLAFKAEKPGRTVTIWPGFAISQRPITVSEYKRFVEATSRKVGLCPRPEGEPVLAAAKDPTVTAATCVSYEDATAYATWLSSRTGKVYRLPTAAQWEFVARGAVDPDAEQAERPLVSNDGKSAVVKGWKVAGMKVGVAEIVLDCWSEKLEVVEDGATGRNKPNCQSRVLKGAARGEEPRWQQPWSRRPIPTAAQSLDVGFRIVRMN